VTLMENFTGWTLDYTTGAIYHINTMVKEKYKPGVSIIFDVFDGYIIETKRFDDEKGSFGQYTCLYYADTLLDAATLMARLAHYFKEESVQEDVTGFRLATHEEYMAVRKVLAMHKEHSAIFVLSDEEVDHLADPEE
jgi:hypothetical protein